MHALRNVLLLLLGVVVGAAGVVGALWLQPAFAQVPQLAPPPAIATPAVAPPRPAEQSPARPTPLPAVPASSVPTPTAAAAPADLRGRLQPDEQLLVDLYEHVSPAVVNITNRRGQQ